MTGSRADDARARERALDPGGSFIVQAPAGAGKTELLVQRFLVLLARASVPEEILAITFTRKAAGEMRDRILAALELATAAEPPDSAHKRRTWALARAALETDARCGWRLRENPSRLRLQTIDALCGALTRRAPVLSGFGARARILEDAMPLYREAARQTIAEVEAGERWSGAIAHLLGHLDNDLPAIEGMIARMLAKREQWQRHAGSIDRDALECALASVNREALVALSEALPAGMTGELVAVARYALENCADEDAARALEALADGSLPGTGLEALDPWRRIAAILLRQDGGWRRQLTVREGFPAPGGAKGEEATRRAAMKERAMALIETLGGNESLRVRLAALEGLPPAAYDESQWRTIEAFRELLILASAMLEVTFRERGEVDFPSIARGALAALGDEGRPTDLALVLDHRIRHILVDEFQDTSHVQYDLLRDLTAGWERGDGRTLFLVGDPMQSIYRFREADVGLYLQARRAGIGDVALEPLSLGVNHRSQAGVIDWVNEAFARVLPPSEDLASGAVTYVPSHAHHERLDGEAVQVHALIGDEGAGEPALVCRLVEEALAEGPGHTVAILVRSRPHLAGIVPALKAAGLRFIAVDIDPLAERPVVQDLIALTFALTHPADRIAWLALLRAPWCGLTLGDLHALAGGDRCRTVWELMQDESCLQALGGDGRARLERIRPVLARALRSRRRRGLRAWVEDTWTGLGGPACCAGAGELDDARALLDLLDELDAGADLPDRGMLMERAKSLFARPDPEGDPRLQIMTVHKAKGLEFDTVIVPGLGRKARNDEAQLLRWVRRPQGDLLLAPIQARGDDTDPIYRYICGLEKAKAEYEDGRLLYVAATRARRRLHLIGCVATDSEGAVRAPPPSSLLARLWPAVADVFARAAAARPAAHEEPALDPDGAGDARRLGGQVLRRLVADWSAPPPPPAVAFAREHVGATVPDLVEFAWAGETARHVGTVTHRLLQQCARAGINDAGALDIDRLGRAARIALAGLGVPAGDVDDATGRVIAALRATLEDERGRWILDPAHDEARCEYALSSVREGRLVRAIVDRTFIDADGARWIIDYKTGSHEGGGVDAFLDREVERYRGQLESYAGLFSARESRPVRLGLYFPLLRGWREWIAGDGPG